ncbi:MAG: VOC family protein [Planctomycetaceae bacterium]|nr:VOC family protein [Planctomycetaceae bacterium]
MIIPCLHYYNAPAAIDWLCRVFGFDRHLIVPGEGEKIAHAELTCGTGMVMLGSKSDNEYGRLIKQPSELDGCETMTAYVVVPDADVVYARVRAAGAEVVIDIKTEDYGGRGFTCRDLEGHLWTIGTYDPRGKH